MTDQNTPSQSMRAVIILRERRKRARPNESAISTPTTADNQTEQTVITPKQSRKRARANESAISKLTTADNQTEQSVITPKQSRKRARANESAVSTPSTEISINDPGTCNQVESTPKKKKPNKDMDLKNCCPICFDSFGTSPLASTRCGHVFCLKCITRARKTEPKCPTCRRSLKAANAVHPLFM